MLSNDKEVLFSAIEAAAAKSDDFGAVLKSAVPDLTQKGLTLSVNIRGASGESIQLKCDEVLLLEGGGVEVISGEHKGKKGDIAAVIDAKSSRTAELSTHMGALQGLLESGSLAKYLEHNPVILDVRYCYICPRPSLAHNNLCRIFSHQWGAVLSQIV